MEKIACTGKLNNTIYFIKYFTFILIKFADKFLLQISRIHATIPVHVRVSTVQSSLICNYLSLFETHVAHKSSRTQHTHTQTGTWNLGLGYANFAITLTPHHRDLWIILSLRIWGYVLHVEHISCVITNCGQHQRVIPFPLSIALQALWE